MALLTPENVQLVLKELGIQNVEIRTFDVSTATAQEAADAIGTPIGTIVKSLCFMVEDVPILVLTAGDRRVDDKKIAAHFGTSRKRVKIADAETTIRVTGFAPGGVAPVGHLIQLPIYVDASLQRFETVYASAGSANSIFPIKVSELVKITNGQIADVAKEVPGGPS